MKRVVSVEIRFATGLWDLSLMEHGGSAAAWLTMDDGTVETFGWFHDEIRYVADDFVGKTMAEIKEMHRERDTAYFRS